MDVLTIQHNDQACSEASLDRLRLFNQGLFFNALELGALGEKQSERTLQRNGGGNQMKEQPSAAEFLAGLK